MTNTSRDRSWLDRPVSSIFPALTGELLVFVLIVVLAAFSRLYNLGDRVMSHDESLHVYFSWLFSQGQGYQHQPMMHGPLQFHLLALTYSFFGATDFTARLPHALASILTIVLLWKWRRYLGRAGTLVAAGLMLISPFMLYYGRYARNEAFVGLFGVLTLYAILRHLETGRKRYLVLLTLATVLHFTVKETAFIYTAQAMLFLAFVLVKRAGRKPWKVAGLFNGFIVALSIGMLLAGATLGLVLYDRSFAATDASRTLAPLVPGQASPVITSAAGHPVVNITLAVLIGISFLIALIFLAFGYGWKNLRAERSFSMLILLGTFVLPQLTAFPVKALGWDPLAYNYYWPGWNLQLLWAQAPVRTGVVFLLLCVLSVAIGMAWDVKRWPLLAVLFLGIYVFFYTSMFTNWQGFFTGSVGSLGYWLEQQGVHRGSQPWYYYLLIQIPVYEFLPALGLGLSVYLGLRMKKPAALPSPTVSTPDPDPGSKNDGRLTFPLLAWWAGSSLLAFSLAGEKMPWLTLHIILPMILLTGWALGQVIERLNWSEVRTKRTALTAILMAILAISLGGALVMALGANPPFHGKNLEQLNATGSFLFAALLALSSAGGLYYLFTGWQVRDALRLAALVIFSLSALLTARASYRAAFVNSDEATEFLVYAHGARGIKDVMAQIDMLSDRVVGGRDLNVAYDTNLPDQGVAWPFKWYLREYPNAISFNEPGVDLSNVPVIIVDRNNFDKIKPIVGENYYRQDFIRMVWPNQDYFDLNQERIRDFLTNPAMRSAVFQIWLNRDYSQYARVTGKNDLTLSKWSPSDAMQLFIRKDIAANVWEYNIMQVAAVRADPYANGKVALQADLVIGSAGVGDGQFSGPRGLTVAPDGTIYIADTGNNRIQHFSADGQFLNTLGSVGIGTDAAPAPPGTFNQPWDVAVSPDGAWIYVADTWNHRIQKLTASGQPVDAWGVPNYQLDSSDPFGLWGPRGIIVDAQGRVLVTDTGNKRVLIYDTSGNYLAEFGGQGADTEFLDEPVGLALDSQGNLYVADTWNQRIRVYSPVDDERLYAPSAQWVIAGWVSQSQDNKPYLAIDQQGFVFVTDPEEYRVLEFTKSGEFVRAWGDYGTGPADFGLASGVAVDREGRVWVSDSANDRIVRFVLP